jgi:hypothetical protein
MNFSRKITLEKKRISVLVVFANMEELGDFYLLLWLKTKFMEPTEVNEASSRTEGKISFCDKRERIFDVGGLKIVSFRFQHPNDKRMRRCNNE